MRRHDIPFVDNEALNLGNQDQVILNPDEAAANALAELLTENSAGPFDPGFLVNDPIDHREFPEDRRTLNVTQPGHTLHDAEENRGGRVEQQIHFEDGMLIYDIVGTGDGPFPKINTFTATNAIFGKYPGINDPDTDEDLQDVEQLQNGFVSKLLDRFRIKPGG